MENRRKELRVGIQTPVAIDHPGGHLDGVGSDLNQHSMLVLSEAPLPIGTPVTLRCVDDFGRAIEVQGVVVRHQQDAAGARGFVVSARDPAPAPA